MHSEGTRTLTLHSAYRHLTTRYVEVSGQQFAINKEWARGAKKELTAFIKKNSRHRLPRTCVIVGNGPSINKTDLSGLGEVDVLISNFAFEHQTLLSHAKHLAIVNHLVAEQARTGIEHLLQELPKLAPKLESILVPTHLRSTMPESALFQYVEAAPTPAFQANPRAGASCQSTVTYFLLQFAYWLGYQKVILIGVDNTYIQPKEAKEGTVLLQRGADPNHFSETYFSGKYWQAADPHRMQAAYELAQIAYSSVGRLIVDCTVDGALYTYPKGDLTQELSQSSPAMPTLDASAGKTGALSSVKTLLSGAGDWAALALSLVVLQAIVSTFAFVFGGLISAKVAFLSLSLCFVVGLGAMGALLYRLIQRQADQVQFELLVYQAKFDQLQRSKHAND